jgi:hypothetical protein
MCGIVGVFGTPSIKLDKVFKDLLQFDVVRGWDSTGAFAVANKAKVKIVKGAMLPQDLMEEPEFMSMMARQNFGLVGHNRQATKGKITDANAHPFRHGNITLVHNGTLHTQWGLPDHDKFETDSESLCYHINQLGIDEVWPEVYGGTAMCWWDSNLRTLNLLRNKDRPLCFAHTKRDNGIILASKPWMIRVAAEEHEVELVADEGGNEVFEPLPHQLFSFHWDGKVVKRESRMLQERKPYYSRNGEAKPGQSVIPFRQQQSANQNGGTGKDKNTGQLATEAASNRIIEDHVNNVLGPRNICDLPPWMGSQSLEEMVAQWYDDSDRLKSKAKLNEELFHRRYPKCCSCSESLAGEFKTSILIDERKALCNGCTLTAAMNDMDINTMNFTH